MQELSDFMVKTFGLNSEELESLMSLLQAEELEEKDFFNYLETLEKILTEAGKSGLEQAQVFLDLMNQFFKSSLNPKRKLFLVRLVIEFADKVLNNSAL